MNQYNTLMTDIQNHLDELIALFRRASTAVMDIYDNQTLAITNKSDDSPVTQADIASHQIITPGLIELFPTIPVISEEGSEEQNRQTLQSDSFWLVDPLDGTKEFIAHNDEFVICAGLIQKGVPVFGIVIVPATGMLYYGGPTTGSFAIQPGGAPTRIHTSAAPTHVVMAGRSHRNEATDAYLAEHFSEHQRHTVGSLLKFIEIAKGNADAFPRLDHGMKLWDVAAGHAILAGAGGTVTQLDGQPLHYTRSDFRIGDFIARA